MADLAFTSMVDCVGERHLRSSVSSYQRAETHMHTHVYAHVHIHAHIHALKGKRETRKQLHKCSVVCCEHGGRAFLLSYSQQEYHQLFITWHEQIFCNMPFPVPLRGVWRFKKKGKCSYNLSMQSISYKYQGRSDSSGLVPLNGRQVSSK